MKKNYTTMTTLYVQKDSGGNLYTLFSDDDSISNASPQKIGTIDDVESIDAHNLSGFDRVRTFEGIAKYFSNLKTLTREEILKVHRLLIEWRHFKDFVRTLAHAVRDGDIEIEQEFKGYEH